MKVKGSVKIEFWFDEKIRLYGAAYKDTATGEILGEAEFGATKAKALEYLEESTPEFEYEKKDKNAQRE